MFEKRKEQLKEVTAAILQLHYRNGSSQMSHVFMLCVNIAVSIRAVLSTLETEYICFLHTAALHFSTVKSSG